MSQKNAELVLLPELPTLETALDVFRSESGLEPYIQHVRAEAAKLPKGDVSTATGRKAIASAAYAVTRSKTAIDNLGKQVADQIKAIPKLVDASRMKMRSELDTLAAEIRQPLTDWEQAEEKRKREEKERAEKMQAAVQKIAGQGQVQWGTSADVLRERISRLEGLSIEPAEWGEYAESATQARTLSLTSLRNMLKEREAFEAQQQELALLKADAQVSTKQAGLNSPHTAAAAASPEQHHQGITAEPAGPMGGVRQNAANSCATAQDPGFSQAQESDADHRTPAELAAAAMVKIAGISQPQAEALIAAISKGLIPGVCIE